MQSHGDPAETVIRISKVSTRFGTHVVHSGIDLEVRRAEVFAVIGGSGSGKSTLLREMILLHQPDEGSIRVLGVDLHGLAEEAPRSDLEQAAHTLGNGLQRRRLVGGNPLPVVRVQVDDLTLG